MHYINLIVFKKMLWNIVCGILIFIVIVVVCCYQNLGRDRPLENKSIEIVRMPSERETYI